MDADGTDPRRLTFDPLPGVTAELRPAWSPDRSRIAYASNVVGTFDIWAMRADGGDAGLRRRGRPREATRVAAAS